MNRWIMRVIVAIAMAGGCSSDSMEDEDRPRQAAADPAPAASAVDPHAGHVMREADPTSDSAQAAMPVDHGAHSAMSAPATHPAHSGMQGMQQAAGEAAADHAQHRRPTTAAQRAAPATGHAGHPSGGPAIARGGEPGLRGGRPTDGASDAHAVHAHTPNTAPAVGGGDPGWDKLLTLVAELVRDTIVQRRIERDPVLRAQWEDPGVRAVLLPPE